MTCESAGSTVSRSVSIEERQHRVVRTDEPVEVPGEAPERRCYEADHKRSERDADASAEVVEGECPCDEDDCMEKRGCQTGGARGVPLDAHSEAYVPTA